jgi:hypothetical protein
MIRSRSRGPRMPSRFAPVTMRAMHPVLVFAVLALMALGLG